jgi:hypothetical protein
MIRHWSIRHWSIRLLISVPLIFVYLVGVSPSGAGVITYNTCIQDDSSGYSIQINSTTGDYKFKRCSDGFTLTGQGSITSHGSSFTLQHYPSDRRVQAGWMTGGAGSASLQMGGATIISITDRSIANGNCGS